MDIYGITMDKEKENERNEDKKLKGWDGRKQIEMGFRWLGFDKLKLLFVLIGAANVLDSADDLNRNHYAKVSPFSFYHVSQMNLDYHTCVCAHLPFWGAEHVPIVRIE